MIPKISASEVYSVLGNNSSLIPLGIKDIANSCGLTTASYIAGDKVEGNDRLIDEFGTQGIWLLGIPTGKLVIDNTLFRFLKLDPKVDVRLFKDKNILQAAIDFAPTKEIKHSIEHAAANLSLHKKLTLAKFGISTAMTALAYLGLTKFRHNYTENKIKKDYLERKNKEQGGNFAGQEVPFSASFADVHNPNSNNKGKNVAFTGLKDFMFDPVKNLMIVDGVITGERFTHSRNPQDFMGYVIKEGSFWLFMYGAGQWISNALEKYTEKKYGKSIDLDARVIECEEFKKAFADGSLKKHLAEFKKADLSDVDIYKFAVNPDTDNIVVKMAKKSDILPLLKTSLFKKSENIVDTRQYINLSDLRGLGDKIEKLVSQYDNSSQNLDEFFKTLRKLKRGAVLKNMGACIGALGVIAPAIMLAVRHFSSEPEYQVKKDIEAKLDKIG